MSDGKIDMTATINGRKVNCKPLAREVLKRGWMTRQEMREWIWKHVKEFEGLSEVIDDESKEWSEDDISGFSPSAGKRKPLTQEDMDGIADMIIDSLVRGNVLCQDEDSGKYAVTGAASDYLK